MRIIKASSNPIEAIAYSPDGRMLASCSGGSAVTVWNLSAGTELWKVTAQRAMGAMTFSPDSRWLVVSNVPAGADVRAAETGESIAFLPVVGAQSRYGGLRVLAFSPDCSRLVTGGTRNGRLCLQWWNPSNWFEAQSWEDDSDGFEYRHAVFTSDGSILVTMDYGAVRAWDVSTKKCEWETGVNVRHGVTTLAISPDGRYLVFAAGPALRVIEMVSFKEIARLEPSTRHIQCAAFSPNGHVLGTVGNDKHVRLWETGSWQQMAAYSWNIGQLKCVAFSPDGCVAAAGGDKGKIVLWDLH